MAIRLSKSRYVSGLQCAQRLYLEIHEGMMASLQFHRMAFGDGDSAEKAEMRDLYQVRLFLETITTRSCKRMSIFPRRSTTMR